MSHKRLNLRDGAFSISSFPLLSIRRQLRQPRGQDGSNLHKSLFQVESIFLGRTATRKVRMVRPVGEIDGHKGLGKVVLDARDRPTVVETVGEQNVRGTASRQVVNVPALYQLVRLRFDAKARLAVLRQPLEGPGTVGKHAAGIATAGTCYYYYSYPNDYQHGGNRTGRVAAASRRRGNSKSHSGWVLCTVRVPRLFGPQIALCPRLRLLFVSRLPIRNTQSPQVRRWGR